MKDRTVVITGANSGIGKAAAYRFASEGYTVVMACRNLEKSQNVQKEMVEATGNDRIDLMTLDVASFASISDFCREFKNRYEKLDILIHNAAYFNHGSKHRLSADGLELTFATNVFGPYLMTSLLLGCLSKSEDPRILHAGSNIIKHFFDPKKKIQFEYVMGKKKDPKFSVYKMYCQSKMALLMLGFKMAEEYKGAGIKVNTLQINGAVMSKETLKKVTPGYRMVARVQNLFFRPAEYMANNYFEICTSEKYKDITGQLFNDKLEIMQPASGQKLGIFKDIKQTVGTAHYPAYAENMEIREKLWELCKEVTAERIGAEPAGKG
ncbi:SDR family oxidoreductase [Salipaludibacillus aurantiacus]|uniref:NAD(P)-dependent dehydrogenase, short-chain alcohol dehydrogenase family n=1 Tax=Salipaludibacillus aurantiacus TaxID=1601833 RepID=A0A1H9UPU8_9BACI|nr:SDR family oxidoreductase [Salipaludibacillus aurantiacus]SES11033.1 NAD(P)-dependent dehydrogenase, short-chain alcohol dehydrogenase family [Salipaludibacillus aurantiacus]